MHYQQTTCLFLNLITFTLTISNSLQLIIITFAINNNKNNCVINVT